MTRTRPTGSPRGTPSVLSSSSGPLTPQTGTSDSSSSRRHDTRSAASGDMASQVAAIRLEGNPDLPLPSVERAPTDSSAGIDTPAETSHSRTPSLSISPPPSDGPMTRRSQVPGAIRGQRSTGDESSGAGGRLGMAEVAVALDRVARGSDSPGTHLRPVNPSVGAAASRRVVSRRRSSSRTSTEPHKVTDEKPPDDRFNRPEFQQAFSDAKGAVDKLSRILASSTLHDEAGSTVMRLHQKATDLATFQCPLTRTIGFVGDSGVGKSSLLNSLLDKRGLARTSNSGAACTCVVTEYHYHDEDKFIVQVDLFSSSELHAQLTNHLESYRHYHLHGDEMDAEQRQDFEEQALLARDTFRAMFRGRMSDENFLIEREKEDVLKTLQTWAEVGAESMEYQYERNSCEECSAVLIGLTSEAHSSQSPAMWPYIKKIKVSLKTHILSKGLVLVDLPGLRDVNSARQAITERYLLKCDGIFVVCNIGRATTDAAVANVFELAVRTRLSNVGIVCTKSDDIRADEAKEDWGEGEALRIQSLMDAVAAEQANLQTIQAELDEFGELDELSPDELVEHHTLSSQSRRAGRQLASHKFELKRYLIETRNSSVTADLNTAYADKIANNDLRVFCVSNTEYWDHRDSPRDDALPHLQLSGILSLRKYCIAMVSENQLRIATQYIRSDVPALLGDVDLWVQSGAGSITAEHKARIRETLHVVEKRLVREFTGTSSQLRRVARSCKNLFQDHVSARFTIGPWTNAARAASNEWRGWHHSTYSAFCRNYGNYCTSAVGAHNWNEEAIHQMTSDLALPWQGLRSALQNAHHDNLAMVVSLWTWAVEFLDNELGDEDRSTDILKGALESRQDLLSNTLEAAFAQFETKLITLETDALCGIRTSFIGQLMEGSYRACNFESGRGSDVRRKDIITRRLSDQAVFQSLHTNFQNGFQALANEFQDSVRSAIKEHLGVVQGTLDIIRSENVALESERDPAFRGRVQAGVGAARAEIGRIRAAIAS